MVVLLGLPFNHEAVHFQFLEHPTNGTGGLHNGRGGGALLWVDSLMAKFLKKKQRTVELVASTFLHRVFQNPRCPALVFIISKKDLLSALAHLECKTRSHQARTRSLSPRRSSPTTKMSQNGEPDPPPFRGWFQWDALTLGNWQEYPLTRRLAVQVITKLDLPPGSLGQKQSFWAESEGSQNASSPPRNSKG